MYPLKKGKFAQQAHVGHSGRHLRGGARTQRLLRQERAPVSRASAHRLDPLRRQAAAALLRPEPARARRSAAIPKACPWPSWATTMSRFTSRAASQPMPFYYRNADGDELIFVHRGKGTIETDFGPLRVRAGRLPRHAARGDVPHRARDAATISS